MAALEWGISAPYYAGVDHAVLYLPGMNGIAWNGLVSVDEISGGATGKQLYFDGINSGLIQDSEDFRLSVSAFTYPEEFSDFTGYSDIVDKQKRRTFGMSYRTGDDVTGQIHLIYNATAAPSKKRWKSSTRITEASLFEWDILTKPVVFKGIRPTAHLTIDIASTPSATLNALTKTLYGSPTTNPTLPSLSGVFQIFEDNAEFQVTDNGDGTWTARGSDTAIQYVDTTNVKVSWSTVIAVDPNIYTMSTDY